MTSAVEFTTRERFLFSQWAITPEMWARGMAAQGDACGLCGKPPGERSLCVDDDHDTKLIRGFLHSRCNMTIQSKSTKLSPEAQAYLADPPLARFGWYATDDAKRTRRAVARSELQVEAGASEPADARTSSPAQETPPARPTTEASPPARGPVSPVESADWWQTPEGQATRAEFHRRDEARLARAREARVREEAAEERRRAWLAERYRRRRRRLLLSLGAASFAAALTLALLVALVPAVRDLVVLALVLPVALASSAPPRGRRGRR